MKSMVSPEGLTGRNYDTRLKWGRQGGSLAGNIYFLAMITAYLDDTGAEQFVGYGGFVGESREREAVNADWVAENEKHVIREFHAEEYPKLVPAYAGVALRHQIHLLGYTIDLKAYSEYNPTGRKRSPFGLNAWATSADACVWKILD